MQKERCVFLLKSKGYSESDIDLFCDAGICCYDLSRISRSISHTLQIHKLLKENNLRLYTCDGAFTGDINGQNAKIMVSTTVCLMSCLLTN
ncbi:recombinase family protein [Proteiniborus sp.]|uniref:recombinase family protein n=1 Tax=Proteiniborus sp. TaxID=2079015 RepID=UPI0033201F41